jgi:hypothetical protein
VGCEHFFADISSKIIALADPILSQPDMEREMVSPPAGAYIPSFTIYHVLPNLSGHKLVYNIRRHESKFRNPQVGGRMYDVLVPGLQFSEYQEVPEY